MSGIRIGARALISTQTQLLSKSTNNHSSESVRTFSVTINRNMKFLQFTYDCYPNDIRVGYVVGDSVIDINRADCTMPTTMLDILKLGVSNRVFACVNSRQGAIPLSSVKVAAPIYGVDKILCVARNYEDHCKEQGMEIPPIPVMFSKFSSTIIGQNEPLKIRTEICKKVDWEVELAVVIGKKACSIKAAEANEFIFGYTIAQDISGRDWQKEKNGGQFLLGKSQDTFCPIGPYIVTEDEIGDPHKLNIKCSVNGVEKQSSNTSQIIHKIPSLIERLTSVMTLLPGDLILTGTPGGVGLYRNPPEFLKPGDVITSEIEKIGILETKVSNY